MTDMERDVAEAEKRIREGRVPPLWLVGRLCRHLRRIRNANLDLLARVTAAEMELERRHERNGGHRRIA